MSDTFFFPVIEYSFQNQISLSHALTSSEFTNMYMTFPFSSKKFFP